MCTFYPREEIVFIEKYRHSEINLLQILRSHDRRDGGKIGAFTITLLIDVLTLKIV